MTRSRYEEFAPAPELRRHVLTYWRFTAEVEPGDTFRHHVWPDGCVSLVLARQSGAARCTIVGPTIHAAVVELRGRTDFTGIRFWPDTGATVLGLAAASLRDRRLPAATFEAELSGNLDEFLLRRGVPAVPIDEPLRRVVTALVARHGAVPAGELADLAGWTSRHLQRKFGQRVGLTPKAFGRIRRVRTVIGAILGGRRAWAEVAAEFGYADQAHMARELAAITGFPPSAVEQRLATIEHISVTP